MSFDVHERATGVWASIENGGAMVSTTLLSKRTVLIIVRIKAVWKIGP